MFSVKWKGYIAKTVPIQEIRDHQSTMREDRHSRRNQNRTRKVVMMLSRRSPGLCEEE